MSNHRAAVVPLNEAGAVFAALAAGIRGAAVDWTSEAVQQLESELMDRYGELIGGPGAVKRLVALATEPVAA